MYTWKIYVVAWRAGAVMTNLNLVLIDSLVEMFLLVIVYLKHAAADEGGS